MFDQNNHRGNYVSMTSGFMSRVYGWMSLGMIFTALVAFIFSPYMFPQLMQVFNKSIGLFIALMVVQFGVAMWLSFRWQKMQVGTVAACYVIFSLLNGITLAPILYVYTGQSVIGVFGIAAVMFAIMAAYGWFTNADLSSMGNVLLLGLVGLMIAGFVKIFWANAIFSMVTASIGVGIFSMFIAYDIQNLKRMSQNALVTREDMNKVAIMGAFNLYLNAVNLFLYLLELFGQKRRD